MKDTDHDGHGSSSYKDPDSNASNKSSELLALKIHEGQHCQLSGRHGGQDDKEDTGQERDTEDQKNDRWVTMHEIRVANSGQHLVTPFR